MDAYIPGDVVDQKDGSGTAVESLDDGPEGLLSGCIPDLHLGAGLLIDFDLFGVELDSQRGSVALSKFVLGESVEQAAFAHSGRANYNHLESLLVLAFHQS